MHLINLFSTPIWSTQLECFDNEKLANKIYQLEEKTDSTHRSNEGGFQVDDLRYPMFRRKIFENIPRVPDKELPKVKIWEWININRKGNRNTRHNHFGRGIFLSGIYYVKTPKNSGNVRFYDPRGSMHMALEDYDYYYGVANYQYLVPEPGLCLFFPNWLDHDVEENESDEDRISIAFNVVYA